MKKLSFREACQSSSHLERLLVAEGEVTIIRRGETIARVIPITRKLAIPSPKNLHSKMPRLRKGSEVLIRQDRNGR